MLATGRASVLDTSIQTNVMTASQANGQNGALPPISLTKGLNIGRAQIQGGLRGAHAEIFEGHNNDSVESGRVCRICLDEEDLSHQESNPFITPCGCQGSMKFIHLNCVKEWIDGKKQF